MNLLVAWERWDIMPGSRDRAVAMERACEPVAAELGVSVSTFRQGLNRYRRQGMSRDEALAAYRAELMA